MRRATLERLMAARRDGRTLVRALEIESGEERLIDTASDSQPWAWRQLRPPRTMPAAVSL